MMQCIDFFSFPLFTRSVYFYKNTTTTSPLTQEKVSLEIITQKNFYKKIKEYNQCYIHSIYFWTQKVLCTPEIITTSPVASKGT